MSNYTLEQITHLQAQYEQNHQRRVNEHKLECERHMQQILDKMNEEHLDLMSKMNVMREIIQREEDEQHEENIKRITLQEQKKAE